jgi:hypothetical protein
MVLASHSGHSRGDAERVFAYTLMQRSFPTFHGGSDHGPQRSIRMYFSQRRKAEPTELVGQFTATEATCIIVLRQLYRAYPDRYKLDISYRRLEFARWLVVHGYLNEWCDSPIDEQREMLDLRSQGSQARCA